MPRTPNDEREVEPETPPRQGNLNNRTGPLAPDARREDGGEARDQGDQTEDNRKQQE